VSEKSTNIRPARSEDAPELCVLAMRSKACWGYSREFMEACQAELTYDAAYLDEHEVYVLESGSRIIGFYSLERLPEAALELGALFVEPGDIGKGYGRLLVEHSLEKAREAGASRIVIQGDPNARGFYLAMGATLAGETESRSIPGRMLPLFEVPVAGD
jgi:predicted N-acetyltransferase YhbS